MKILEIKHVDISEGLLKSKSGGSMIFFKVWETEVGW